MHKFAHIHYDIQLDTYIHLHTHTHTHTIIVSITISGGLIWCLRLHITEFTHSLHLGHVREVAFLLRTLTTHHLNNLSQLLDYKMVKVSLRNSGVMISLYNRHLIIILPISVKQEVESL